MLQQAWKQLSFDDSGSNIISEKNKFGNKFK